MQEKVRTDLLTVLAAVREDLQQEDHTKLTALSSRTIHNASIFQDSHSIDIAIVVYSLSKLLGKKPDLAKQFFTYIDQAHTLLLQDQEYAYEQVIREILGQIEAIDKKMGLYITHVIDNARVKKGSHLYYHGLSVGQSAKLVGVTQWELYDYIGKTTINEEDESPHITNLRKRLAFARKVLTSPNSHAIVFDAGPIITFVMNNLLWVLPELKQLGKTDFLIPHSVRYELIDRPLTTKKYKLEALQVYEHLASGTVKEITKKYLLARTREYLQLCNSTFFAHGRNIRVVDEGEMEALALAKITGSPLVVIDERTARYLVEDPRRIIKRLERKLHTHVHVDTKKFALIKKEFKDLKTIRSAELLVVAFMNGVFDSKMKIHPGMNPKKEYLTGLLWAARLSGCGISDQEIKLLIEKLA